MYMDLAASNMIIIIIITKKENFNIAISILGNISNGSGITVCLSVQILKFFCRNPLGPAKNSTIA